MTIILQTLIMIPQIAWSTHPRSLPYKRGRIRSIRSSDSYRLNISFRCRFGIRTMGKRCPPTEMPMFLHRVYEVYERSVAKPSSHVSKSLIDRSPDQPIHLAVTYNSLPTRYRDRPLRYAIHQPSLLSETVNKEHRAINAVAR